MNRVQSIDRAFAILEQIATSQLGLTEIADQVELPKSTVARLLHTLTSIGAVTKTADDGTYTIGDAVRSLVDGGHSVAGFVQHAQPYLRTLARDLGEDAGVSVPVGSGVHYVAQERADNAILVEDWTGTVAPYHLVPAGLVIIAWSPDRAARVLSGRLDAATPASVTDQTRIRRRLGTIRNDGYAWVYGEFRPDLNSVAAPVVGAAGEPLGAIGVHGPAYRFPGDSDPKAIAGRVAEVASSLSDVYR
jgi:IclR family acetate operon transcriptional repressor